MYDVLGREMQSFRLSSLEFSLSRKGLAEGLYFFRISSEEGVLGVGKLVIAD